MPDIVQRQLSRVGGPDLRTRVLRLVRYGATSAVALGVSEATLLIVVGTGLAGATAAALIATAAGIPPSYLLSRYWIWGDADRRRTGRQFVLYWLVSLVAMAITALATGFVAHHSSSRGSEHVELVGMAFLALNVALWLAKYVVYQKIVFPHGRGSVVSPLLASDGRESADADGAVTGIRLSGATRQSPAS